MFYSNCREILHTDVENYKISGRTFSDQTGLYISWSNSGFLFSFKGERVAISFGDYISDMPVYVKVYIDEKSEKFGISGKNPKILIENLGQGKHVLKLVRVSEGEPLIFQKACIYGKQPEFFHIPEKKRLKIEFIGDSITAGFGVMAPKSQDIFYTFEQDSTQTYAYYTAQMLGAEIRTECMSGQGVWRNCGKEEGVQFKRMFNMIIRGKEGFDHSSWVPDIIVLNCGTNDVPGGTDLETMYKEGVILIDNVRKAYPYADIIWLYGMMNNKFSDTLKTLIKDKCKNGDKKLHYLYVKDIYSFKNEVGAIGHPNVNASTRVSKKLSKFIDNILKKPL